MSKRKQWSATFTQIPGDPERFDSKPAAYRWVMKQAELWRARPGALRSPLITVYVDERDGQGRQTYERLDLRELAQNRGEQSCPASQ